MALPSTEPRRQLYRLQPSITFEGKFMKKRTLPNAGTVHRPFLVSGFAVALALAAGFFGAGQFSASAWQGPKNKPDNKPNSDDLIFDTTAEYLVEFYPLWFTHAQALTFNQLIGPDKVTSLYQAVVAVNVDTIYASANVNVTTEPAVLTIPPTTNTYSILTLDIYGDVFDSGIPAQTPGTYAFVGP